MQVFLFRAICVLFCLGIQYAKCDVSAQDITDQFRFGTTSMDRIYRAIRTRDGGYLMAGAVWSSGLPDRGKDDILLIKLNGKLQEEWKQVLGGSGNDHVHDIVETETGYLIAGSTDADDFHMNGSQRIVNKGSMDCLILLLDMKGDIISIHTFGGPKAEYISRILPENDGYVVGAVSNSDAGPDSDKDEDAVGSFDYWLFQLDDQLRIAWQETIGGRSDDRIDFMGMSSKNNNILVGGNSWSGQSGDKEIPKMGGVDIWCMEVDRQLNKPVWQRVYGAKYNNYYGGISSNNVSGNFLQLKNEFILSGGSQSNICGAKQYDASIYRVKSDGNLQSDLLLFANKDDGFSSLVQSDDGGYILAGTSSSDKGGHKSQPSRGYRDAWIVKFDANWKLKWDLTFGGSLNDSSSKILSIGKGEYLVFMTTESGISGDIKIKELDPSSDILVIRLVDQQQ